MPRSRNIVLFLSAMAGLLIAHSCSRATAQNAYPPEFAGSETVVYKQVGDVSLRMWLFTPADHEPAADTRPAVVFFFGGGWKSGTPAQFETHCRYLASRGIVAATADYRVATRHGVKADACVEDAKSAIRWLRQNASSLGLDANRICAGGGSAGGHTACCTALIQGLDANHEDKTISSVPNALALFNPAVMLGHLDGFDLGGITEEKVADIATRTGVPAVQISPIHHIRANMPPTIIFHGMADTTVPYATAEEFSKRMLAAGNRCKLKSFPEAQHGFFNAPKGNNPDRRDRSYQWHRRTLLQLDNFLQSLGWLDGEATVRIVDHDFVSLRGNLTNSLRQFSVEKRGHVAFIGGSITEMEGYRPLVCKWLQHRFPDTEFTFTAAGISSTCSNTGAFRLQRDILAHGPVDLLFVEFAVNDDQDAAHSADGCVRGMEGIIHRLRQHNPNADVVMTHFVNPGMLNTLNEGKVILSANQHERVARHYRIPSVYLSKEVAQRINTGSLTWKQFGGTHPGPAGNELAADLATSILSTGWRGVDASQLQPIAHPLPQELLLSSSFTNGVLLPPDRVQHDTGWKVSLPDWEAIPGGKRSRFLGIPLLHSEVPGALASISFDGTAIGLYVLAGPDAGQVEFRIDDDNWQTVELYHRFSKGLHYPRTVVLATDLKSATHKLEFRVAGSKHATSTGPSVRILAVAINEPAASGS
ncbi:MAG: alpha/beta hydrolase fold domain-containing protein [Fuerstiella sp.]|nr:alpha/beta hydrolase fold domain-containing protein [Fuerstiella sp.]MCP4786304.1 alpha/beta hydrolase fold domain-containing protein [Fuerstiella sp.]MCP4856362.1 alpha/beta hydrolase fold domain-containing protein [Fuerstiella sp.]